MNKLVESIDQVVKKAPQLPQNVKEFLVKIAPWAVVLTVVLSAPAVLAIIGVGSYFSAFGMRGYAYGMHAGYGITLLLLGGVLVLRGISVPGLFARSVKGWNMYFYSTLLYFVYAVFARDIIGGIVGTAISLYLVFQIREYYK